MLVAIVIGQYCFCRYRLFQRSLADGMEWICLPVHKEGRQQFRLKWDVIHLRECCLILRLKTCTELCTHRIEDMLDDVNAIGLRYRQYGHRRYIAIISIYRPISTSSRCGCYLAPAGGLWLRADRFRQQSVYRKTAKHPRPQAPRPTANNAVRRSSVVTMLRVLSALCQVTQGHAKVFETWKSLVLVWTAVCHCYTILGMSTRR